MTLPFFPLSLWNRHYGHLGTAFGQFPFFGLLGRCIRRGLPVSTVTRGACCIWARSLTRSRSQMLSACCPPQIQKRLVLLLVVLSGSLSLSGCAGLTSANKSPSDPTNSAGPVVISVSPVSTTVAAGSTQQFQVTLTGTSNTAVKWSVSGAGCSGAACGTISAGGLYTSPASVPSPATVSVIVTSVAAPTKSASSSVTLVAAAAVLLSITPTSAAVPTASTDSFTATVTGTTDTAVAWSLSGAGCSGSACGSLATSSLAAVYTAPLVAPSPPIVTVVATSVAVPSETASANVTIVPVVVVTVMPASTSVVAGATQQFNASVVGNSNTAVTWTVQGAGCSIAACGTISSTGLYTAPAAVPSPASVTVTATSSADP